VSQESLTISPEADARHANTPTVRRGPRIVILGAGPAGVTAALRLARQSDARVTVLERGQTTGGNAGSFLLDDVWCDYGSHRLHPAAGSEVLDEIRSLLGENLLWRPRHGRILLQKRWIHFPLNPFDLLSRLPKRFTAALALDTVLKRLYHAEERNFATVLRRGLGRTMCTSFYYPYVEKLWGVRPSELAATLAERRVSGSSITKILKKVLKQMPGFKSPTAGGFYYPRFGFGQISEGLTRAATAAGADFVFGADVTGIMRDGERITGVRYTKDGKTHEEPVDTIWSTLPIGMMVRMIEPAAPRPVLEAASRVRFRGMILIYMVLKQDQFTEFDAHYFPELSIPISRMSEPKNYSASRKPEGRTVLCAELPSDPDRPEWQMSNDELGKKLCGWLAGVGLPVTAPVIKVETRRLRFAYPVYDNDYDAHFRTMDEWLTGMKGLLTFGRQGLFAHDNTHHAMTMAFAAVDCFQANGDFDWARWSNYRDEFKSHVVED
jgi:protoporphyrinogen oxidase